MGSVHAVSITPRRGWNQHTPVFLVFLRWPFFLFFFRTISGLPFKRSRAHRDRCTWASDIPVPGVPWIQISISSWAAVAVCFTLSSSRLAIHLGLMRNVSCLCRRCFRLIRRFPPLILTPRTCHGSDKRPSLQIITRWCWMPFWSGSFVTSFFFPVLRSFENGPDELLFNARLSAVLWESLRWRSGMLCFSMFCCETWDDKDMWETSVPRTDLLPLFLKYLHFWIQPTSSASTPRPRRAKSEYQPHSEKVYCLTACQFSLCKIEREHY